MTEKRIIEFYHEEFERLKIKPMRGGVALQHCAWMIEECFKMLFEAHNTSVESETLTKINRWVGFVQGVLWKEGIYTIDQLREHVTTAKEAELAHAKTMVTDYWGGARDATV